MGKMKQQNATYDTMDAFLKKYPPPVSTYFVKTHAQTESNIVTSESEIANDNPDVENKKAVVAVSAAAFKNA